MRFILYIGHHKVGSTALQAYLAQNALTLLQNGILYPPVESQGFSHFLNKAVKSGDVAEFAPVNIREPHSALAYRMLADADGRPIPNQFKQLPPQRQMLLALRNQVAALNPDCVILASEAFINFGGCDATLVDTLRDLFPEAELQIYCALRRPDDYMLSWHAQRLKTGATLAPLRKVGAKPYRDNIHFRYDQAILPWIERCPDARVHVRNYSDILETGGSIEDFTARTGLDLPEGLLPAGRANKSLPHATVEIARLGNAALEPKSARALRRYLIDRTGGLGLVPNREVEMYGAKNRAAILEEFTSIHARLSAATGGDAFFPDLAEMATPRPVDELEAVADALTRLEADGPGDAAADRFLNDLKQRGV